MYDKEKHQIRKLESADILLLKKMNEMVIHLSEQLIHFLSID